MSTASNASRFSILVATDGSASAKAAVTTAIGFPWPRASKVQAVVVREGAFLPPQARAWAAAGETTRKVADSTMRRLMSRWDDATVVVPDGLPVPAILAAAKKAKAHVIVAGWRGHGRFRRLLAGSVSRGVARRSNVPVLVVRGAVPVVRRVVVGVDGASHSGRAVRFLARCTPPKGATATLVTVVAPIVASSHGALSPAFSAQLRAEMAAQNERRHDLATRRLETAARDLAAAGWRVRTVVCHGAPLYELLRVMTDVHGQLLVVGSRGRSALTLGALGSVTEGVLSRCRTASLIVP